MIAPIGFAAGTVELACSCGHEAIDIVIYPGGVSVCRGCHDSGTVLCSCGHIAFDGRDYPNGARLCVPCADAHDRETQWRATRDAARNEQLQALYDSRLKENVKQALREMKEG